MSKKIFFCLTVPTTYCFSTTLISQLRDKGYDVTLISSDELNLKKTAESLHVKYIYMPFYRGMNPLSDLAIIRKLYTVLRHEKPDIVMAATPKASMIAMIAARIAGIKIRLYHIYGLPYETAEGWRKKILLGIEKLTGALATNIVTIGTSVKQSVLEHKLFKESKIQQPGLLTVGGVDLDRFDPEAVDAKGRQLRFGFSIPPDGVVIGFVARYTYDKGFLDIMHIWQKIKYKYPNVYIMIAGDIDKRVPLPEHYLAEFVSDKRVINLGYREDIEKVFSAVDIFLFPSHREGFGNVSIEASAMRIPVVTYNVTGCKDAVADGETGYVLNYQDYNGVITRLSELIENPKLRKQLGENGRQRVIKYFTVDNVAQNLFQVIRQFNKAD